MSILSFGEILWDVYPDRKCLGGAPLNFAAHLAKHGEQVYMLSAVGTDKLGAQALEQVERWGVRTDFVTCDPQKQTGCCMVTLDAQSVPTYDLLKDVAYDYISDAQLTGSFDVLYFGTLALRSGENFRTLRRILDTHRFREVFVDVNIRPPFSTAEAVRFAAERATVLKASIEELPVLYKVFGADPAMPYEAFARMLARRCGGLRCVIITLGEAGAWVLDCDRQKEYACGGVKTEVRSTVGAGDSFSAAFLAGYLKGTPIRTCLEHAVQVAGFVVSCFEAVPEYGPEVTGF